MIKYKKYVVCEFICSDCHLVFNIEIDEVPKNLYCPRCSRLHTTKREG